MSDIDWAALGQPFSAEDVKERQGPRQHDGQCQKRGSTCQLQHRMLSYIDARAVAQRLDDVVTPAGWNFTASIAAEGVVHGRLLIGDAVREDFGYPNSDDDAEPIKSATSDALKRCAVLFGIGRHLYDDNKNGHKSPPPRRPPSIADIARTIPPKAPAHDDPYQDELDELPVLTDDTTCPEHGIAWVGSFGDRYHKKSEGGYCRTAPGNVAKPRR